MSRIYHQSCRNCKRIMTIEEMDNHLKNLLDPKKKDLLGLCNKCINELIEHAKTFKERLEKLRG